MEFSESVTSFNPALVINRTLSSILLSGIVGVVLLPLGQDVQASPAPQNPVATEHRDSALQVTFVPPNGDAPRETRGGAAREGSCLQSDAMDDQFLTALIPQSNYGLTVKSHPIFLVHVPSIPTGSIFFNLRNEDGQSIYEAFIPMQDTTGIISVEMPKEAPPLEIGQNYEWGVAVPCSERLRPDSPFVSGWVQRTESNVVEALPTDTSNLLEYAHQYGQNGLWYDMISLLSDVKTSQAENTEIATIWQNILQSVDLSI